MKDKWRPTCGMDFKGTSIMALGLKKYKMYHSVA